MYVFVAAYGLALLITVLAFYFFPARAAFAFYADAGRVVPSNAVAYGAVITDLRAGNLALLDLSRMEGIVTFPSFHATMAVLYLWAPWTSAGQWRTPLLSVTILMWAAAVPIRGHYVVDLIGGTLVALVAVLGARAWAQFRGSGNWL